MIDPPNAGSDRRHRTACHLAHELADRAKTRRSVAKTGGPDRQGLLPMPGQILLVQIPVLPQLQGGEQRHQSAKTEMPEC